MKLAILFYAWLCSPALSQNFTVPTRPFGDNSNASASTAFVQQQLPSQKVALCTNSASDTTNIQSAINALPATGGIVWIQGPNCQITTTINIGNGNASQGSTVQGVILQGIGNPNTQPILTGFTATNGPKFTWVGSGATGIISINGPLQGWGIQNLYLDCANSANSVGLFVTSGQNGDNRNLTITNCTNSSISSTTVAPFGSFTNTDSLKNNYTNLQLLVPNVANAIGLKLTGVSSGASTTDFNTFTNLLVGMQGGSNVFQVAIYQQNADTNHFLNASVASVGTNTSAQCIYFDYSANNVFPSSNRFTGLDPGACNGGTDFVVNGTPNASAKPNIIFIDEANGASCPNVVNLACYGSHQIILSPGGNGANSVGVTCSGTPTSSFASFNGIVTHC